LLMRGAAALGAVSEVSEVSGFASLLSLAPASLLRHGRFVLSLQRIDFLVTGWHSPLHTPSLSGGRGDPIIGTLLVVRMIHLPLC
jgi:hypothetical protein